MLQGTGRWYGLTCRCCSPTSIPPFSVSLFFLFSCPLIVPLVVLRNALRWPNGRGPSTEPWPRSQPMPTHLAPCALPSHSFYKFVHAATSRQRNIPGAGRGRGILPRFGKRQTAGLESLGLKGGDNGKSSWLDREGRDSGLAPFGCPTCTRLVLFSKFTSF